MKSRILVEIARWTVATVGVAAAVLLRSLLDPILGDMLALATLYGAVALAAWFAGVPQAVFATVAGYLAADYLFIRPRGTIAFGPLENLVGLALYLISCTLIILFGARVRRSDRRRRETDEQLQLALGAGKIATWDWDLRTGRITASPEGQRMLGTSGYGSIEDVLLQLHPDDRAAVRAALDRAIHDGAPFTAQARYTRPSDGEVLHVSVTGVVRVDRFDNPIRIVAAGIDQTEAWRAGESLRHERELLQRTIDTIPVMITVYDPDANILRLNPEFERVTGWSTEAAAGVSLLDEVYPDPAVRETAREFMESCREGWMDFRMRARDGRTVETSWANIRLSDRTQVGIGIDITERKRAEQALRTRNRRLRLLWESAEVSLSSDDADAMLHALFSKIRPELSLDGYSHYTTDDSGDLVLASYEGAPPDAMRASERVPYGTRVVGRVAETRRPLVGTHVLESSDPEEAATREIGIRAYICQPLVAGDGLLGVLTYWSRSRDTFEPDELEFAETLSQYVTLACERIRHLRQLQESGRTKDEFLATLAHELRNPLAPIRNAAHILKQHGPRDPEMVWARQVIDRQAEHLSRLVDDLLDVSRITRGKIELRQERIPVSVVVSSAVETARPLIEANQHALTVSLPGEPLFVNGDLTRLAQVVSNLLANAAKYTPPNGKIEVGAERSGDSVVLRVSDNGVGIPHEMLARIFEMFAQVDSSLERTAGGLGIGLTLARTLIELHGGSIEARSLGAGRGSEFLVRLPLAPSEESKAPPVAAGDAAAGREALARVLVVDDNVDAADSLARLLAMDGYEVRVANGGIEALHEADAFRPDVMLLDIGLPMMNGYDVARRIRREPWGAAVRLVALTGWGQDEDRRRSKEAGFDDHVVKPVDPNSLRSLLRRVRGSQAPASSRST
ncbi:MAG: ATP-binding protein [Bacteroidota bacterium]